MGPVARIEAEARKRPKHGELKRVTMADVYARMDARGVPQLELLDRQVGRSNVTTERWSDRRQQLRAVAIDSLVLSKSEKTWRAYGHWVGVFDAYCGCEGIAMRTAGGEVLAALLQEALADLFYEGMYATGTLRLLVTAVNAWVKDVRGINMREFTEITTMIEGFERKIGLARQKKPPTTEVEVAAFLDAKIPANEGMWSGQFGDLKWLQWVAIVCTAWSLFLRKQEILELQLCDITWEEAGATFLVRKTKNDMKSRTKSPRMEFEGRQGEDGCLLTRVKEYILTVHGDQGLRRRRGCSKQSKPAERCAVCSPLFMAICGNKIKDTAMPQSTLTARLRAGYEVLEAEGVVSVGTSKVVSVSSLRRGGTTQASAAGIRDKVLQAHGRWRSARMPNEYNDVVAGDEIAVSRALQRRVASVRKRKLPDKKSSKLR